VIGLYYWRHKRRLARQVQPSYAPGKGGTRGGDAGRLRAQTGKLRTGDVLRSQLRASPVEGRAAPGNPPATPRTRRPPAMGADAELRFEDIDEDDVDDFLSSVDAPRGRFAPGPPGGRKQSGFGETPEKRRQQRSVTMQQGTHFSSAM